MWKHVPPLRPPNVEMDKPTLLNRLARARQRAEKAHLDVILLKGETSNLESKGQDATEVFVRWKAAINDEQKRLAEISWLLDQLDQLPGKP